MTWLKEKSTANIWGAYVADYLGWFLLASRKGGGGKESLVHTVHACAKLHARLSLRYDALVTFDRMLTSALIVFCFCSS